MVLTEIALLPIPSGSAEKLPGLLTKMTQQKGYLNAWWGSEIENPDTIRLVVDWAELEDHKNFMQSAYASSLPQPFPRA